MVSLVIMHCLEKIPENRYQSCRAVAHDLQRCLSAIEVGSRGSVVRGPWVRGSVGPWVRGSVGPGEGVAVLLLGRYSHGAAARARCCFRRGGS